jgi:phage tail sheath protein FI
VALCQKVQDFVQATRDHIALLDVPPGLKRAQAAAFRSHFDSAYCALYHPWLAVAAAADDRNALVALPPSAAAAGIVAAREAAHGVAHGPANEIVREAVKPLVRITPGEHALLHPLGINAYVQESQGVRLTAARTLSLDPAWRQLSVRRLLLMLRRTLLRQMQWAAFEPNTPALRRQLVHLLTAFLRRLYRLGAFTGASEEQAFFVHCGDELNPPWRVDNGQLVAHIGVAPAEPLEFIVLQFTRLGDGTLALEES